ncbi:unnamed protein product [Schistosoma turkestanicum]|nr:unnamed protein product [Schistosoma turkestanicum]
MNKSSLLLLLYFILCNFLSVIFCRHVNAYFSQRSNQYNGYNGGDKIYGSINGNYDPNIYNNYRNTNDNNNNNNYGTSSYYPTSSDLHNKNNGDNYNINYNDGEHNTNDYTSTKNKYQVNNYNEDYTPSTITPSNDYGIASISTGVMSGSKHSHGRLDVNGRMTGIGHQDYGVHYLSLTKFRKGGGYDIFGKKRQFLDYDTLGHVKKYGNKQMRAKFEVVGNLKGSLTFNEKSSITPNGGGSKSYNGKSGKSGRTY